MILKFLGGAQEVGRSAILLKDDNRSLLFDYGVKIDHKMEYPIATPDVDGLIVSHAHLDHSGSSPWLYEGAPIPTFGTIPTMELSTLLLEDSLNIAKKQHHPRRFHKRQIREFGQRFVSLEYGKTARLGNFDIELYDAGHICGSAITKVERAKAKDYKRIVYTGDFKLEKQSLHDGATVVESDVLIMESTYAKKDHVDRQQVIDGLVSSIREVLANGGTALLPAFAVGRSQELLAILQANGLAEMTHVDGMSRAATAIAMHHPGFLHNFRLLSDAVDQVGWVEDIEDRRAALKEPSIILTTSGMLNGGPVLSYITKLNKHSRIFLTGYQVEKTNGRMLLEQGKIILDEVPRKIATPVSFHDLSAHAGRNELLEYVKRSSPQVVVCVHGSEENAKSLMEDINETGIEAHAPQLGDTIRLDE
jgi:putative mRNA 3-end processing factor